METEPKAPLLVKLIEKARYIESDSFSEELFRDPTDRLQSQYGWFLEPRFSLPHMTKYSHLEQSMEAVHQAGGVEMARLNGFRRTLCEEMVDGLDACGNGVRTSDFVGVSSEKLLENARLYRESLGSGLGLSRFPRSPHHAFLEEIELIEAMADKAAHKFPGIPLYRSDAIDLLTATVEVYRSLWDTLLEGREAEENAMRLVNGAEGEIAALYPRRDGDLRSLFQERVEG